MKLKIFFISLLLISAVMLSACGDKEVIEDPVDTTDPVETVDPVDTNPVDTPDETEELIGEDEVDIGELI